MSVRLLPWAIVALSWLGVAAADPPLASAYGRLPTVIDAAISPDGGKIALAQMLDDAGTVRVRGVGGADILSLRVGDRQRLRSVSFADDSTLVYVVSETVAPAEVAPQGVRLIVPGQLIAYRRAVAVSLRDRQPRLMLGNENNFLDPDMSDVFAPVAGDPGSARMTGYVDPLFNAKDRPGRPGNAQGGARTALYRVDLASGQGRVIDTVNGAGVRFLLDAQGAVVAHTQEFPASNRWQIHVHEGRSSRLLLERRNRTGDAPSLTLLPDGRAAFIETLDGRDGANLTALDLRTGVTATLFDAGRFGVEGHIVDPWTHHLVGASWMDDIPRQKFFDPELAAAYAALANRLPDNYVALSSWSRDRTRMLVRLENGGDGGGWYVFEPANGRLEQLALDYPDIPAAGIGQVFAITYRARDGTPIPAVLTLPRGAEAKNLPLVVLVHGGPANRDDLRFDWWAHFLAARGYAVLQPNFRGSSGYGDAWENAGLREWGGRMQTDVVDGAAALAAGGRVDPARMCIVGASYGGFAALAGATLTPERFACAVSVNGVSDPAAFLDARIRGSGRTSSVADYWRLSIGDPVADRDRIAAASPYIHAADARAPILLLHGQQDSTVPIDQSRRMKEALERAGKSVRYVELVGDDHYLSAASTRTRMLEEVDAFLKPHLSPAR